MNTALKGLVRKEWILSKWVMVWIVMVDILVIVVAPSMVTSFTGVPDSLYQNTHVMAGIWFALHTFAGVSLLFLSLSKEMKNPQTWLHSPCSMVQLAGSKALFSILTAIGSLFFSGILTGIVLYVTGDWSDLVWQSALGLLSVLLAISLKLSFVTFVGWFFWSIYQVIMSRVRFISVPITIMLLVFAITIWEYLRINDFFDWLRTLGPVRLTNESFYNEQTSYFFMGFVPDGVALSLGSLLFYVVVSYLLLTAGAKLFEKKVRL